MPPIRTLWGSNGPGFISSTNTVFESHTCINIHFPSETGSLVMVRSCQVVEKQALSGPESQGACEWTFATFYCSAPCPLYLLIRIHHPITRCKSWKWKHKLLVMISPFDEDCWPAISSPFVTFVIATFMSPPQTFMLLPILNGMDGQDSWRRMLLYPAWGLLLSAVVLLTIPRAAMLLVLCGRHWMRHWAHSLERYLR